MKKAALMLACVVLGIQAQEPIPSLTVGTNTYLNATIRKRNGIEVIVKFDGGLAMLKSKELPEPYRQLFYDSKAESQAELRVSTTRQLKEDQQKSSAVAFSEHFIRTHKPLRVIDESFTISASLFDRPVIGLPIIMFGAKLPQCSRTGYWCPRRAARECSLSTART